MVRWQMIRGFVGVVTLLAATITSAAARIDMVLGTDPQFPATSQRDWYDLFTSLKVDNVQIRSAIASEKLEIASQGTEASPRYRVVGRLTPSNDLVLPGGRFGLRDRAGLQRWLDTLRNEGPDRAKAHRDCRSACPFNSWLR